MIHALRPPFQFGLKHLLIAILLAGRTRWAGLLHMGLLCLLPWLACTAIVFFVIIRYRRSIAAATFLQLLRLTLIYLGLPGSAISMFKSLFQFSVAG